MNLSSAHWDSLVGGAGMNPCSEHEESIGLLASGALDQGEKDVLHRHMRSCPACREYYRSMRALCDGISEWARSMDHVPVPDGLHKRVAERIMTGTYTQKVRSGIRLLHLWRSLVRQPAVWASLAACLLVGMSCWYLLLRGERMAEKPTAVGDSRQPADLVRGAPASRSPVTPSYEVYLEELYRSPDRLYSLLDEHAAKLMPTWRGEPGLELAHVWSWTKYAEDKEEQP